MLLNIQLLFNHSANKSMQLKTTVIKYSYSNPYSTSVSCCRQTVQCSVSLPLCCKQR